MVDNETVVELCHLISESNLTVKKTALEYLLGLSGSHQGLNVFVCNTKLITSLIALAHQPFNDVYDSLLLSTLINCAEIPSLCETMIEDTSFICSILNRILSKETTTDLSCKLLTNLTRFSLSVNSILNAAKQSLFALVNRYCSNDTSCEYLSLVFSNMSVNFSFTEFLFKDNCSIFNRLIAFLGHKSLVCRKGASLLIKNSVFHISLHDIIFKSNIDLISKVLMPLAGPEEYSDDENDKLPIDLQYLPSNKKREVSAEIRLTLLQSLHKLCTTELGRKCVSDCGTYLILRELEKEENEKSVLYELHKVVQILIGDHIEGNLSDVAIPSELEAEFKKYDEENSFSSEIPC